MSDQPGLKKTLSPLMLWGLGVGYVISGMYFGWNLGLPEGGTTGMAIATAFIIVMYVTFTFSYTEMACAIPKAGGGFEYARRALGDNWGFLAGMAQNIEFIFAPPAIAMAIGVYFQLFVPSVDAKVFALIAYLLFTGLNIAGVKAAAKFELIITVLAVGELLLFAGVCLPEVKVENLVQDHFPHGWGGVFKAVPFAIWFFLAIEGVANVAEEARNPQKSVLIGFGSAILTLVVLCLLTFIAAVGVGGWANVVYPEGATEPSDSPLPLALGQLVESGHWLFHLLVTVGLFGLVASFHGILLAAGRSSLEFGRVGYFPKALGQVNAKRGTPVKALLFNMVIGIIALFTGKTGEIITLACFGAVTLYIISMIAFFKLRKTEPQLERPFKVPLFPLFPALALVIALAALAALVYASPLLALIFFGILMAGFVVYKILDFKSSR